MFLFSCFPRQVGSSKRGLGSRPRGGVPSRGQQENSFSREPEAETTVFLEFPGKGGYCFTRFFWAHQKAPMGEDSPHPALVITGHPPWPGSAQIPGRAAAPITEFSMGLLNGRFRTRWG